MVKPFSIFFLIIVPILSNDLNKCGILKPGNDDDINAPWLAAVGKYKSENSDDKLTVICSGSILNNRYIVTAAHCFQGNPPRFLKESTPNIVRIGGNTIDSRYSIDKKIIDVKKHPKYDYPIYYFDVALIVVEDEIRFSSRISPICLPQTPSSHPGDDLSITVQGWGQDAQGNLAKKVHEKSFGVRSRSQCDYEFSHAGKTYQYQVNSRMPQLSENILFCGDIVLSSETGVCRGDSGGVAFRKKWMDEIREERYVLIGIVTGNPTGQCERWILPDVYNFVGNSEILQWIQREINKTPTTSTIDGDCVCNEYLHKGNGACLKESSFGCGKWCYINDGAKCQDARPSNHGAPYNWSCQACREQQKGELGKVRRKSWPKSSIPKSGFSGLGLGLAAILITGGRGAAEQSAELFLPWSNTTCGLPQLPDNRASHVQSGNLVCGGRFTERRTCLKWSAKQKDWVTLPLNLSEPREDSSAWTVSQDYSLVILGGDHSAGNSSEKVSSDGVTTQPTFSMKYKTKYACSISLGDEVIITGGSYTWKTVSRYNKDGWVEDLPSLKVGRSSHGCTQYSIGEDLVLLVTGGYGYGEHLNRLDTTELLRPGSGWQEISSARLPRPLRGMRVTTVENRVLLFGGKVDDGDYSKDILELKDNEKWIKVVEMKKNRYYFGLSVIDYNMYKNSCK